MSLILEPVPLPPKGWRPRPPTDKEKALICLRQEGRCAKTDRKLPVPGAGRVDYHHEPEIWQRPWDEAAQDTIPSGTDITYIFAVIYEGKGGHKEISAKAATERGKTRRLRQLKADLDAAKTKPCGQKRQKRGTIPSRKDPWPKGRKFARAPK